jgi:predicted DNA-binding transcriptional regulator AlpA
MPDDDLLTLKEASELCGVSHQRLRGRCQEGLIPEAVKMGERLWMIPRRRVSTLKREKSGPKVRHSLGS